MAVAEILQELDHRLILDACLDMADSSNCLKKHYGCYLLTEYGLFAATGFNYSVRPSNCEPCPRRDIRGGHELEKCYAVHAEQMAVIGARLRSPYICYIAGYTPNPDGSRGKLWESTRFPCSFCARILAEAGVQFVVMPHSEIAEGYAIQTIDEALDSAFQVAFHE